MSEDISRSGETQWGQTLSDAIRSALHTGAFDQAEALARHGDGLARDLAGEYRLMVRGFGATLAALLDLLQARAARSSDTAESQWQRLLRRLCTDLCMSAGRTPDTQATESLSAKHLHALLAPASERVLARQAALAEQVITAIMQRDAIQAIALLDEKDTACYRPFHDALLRFIAEGFAWTLRHDGTDGLLECHLAMAQAQRAGFERWQQMPARDFARSTALLLRQHPGQVRVTEQADSYLFEQSPCGSGGRLLLGQVDAPHAQTETVDGPRPLSCTQAQLPVYCSHCAIWNGSAPIRWFGHPQWVFEAPGQANGHCRMRIYKQAERAPAQYTTRLRLADTGIHT